MNYKELLKKEPNEIRKIIKEEKTHIIERNVIDGTENLIQGQIQEYNKKLKAEGLR